MSNKCRLLLFYFDYIHQNEEATEFVTKISKLREMLDGQERLERMKRLEELELRRAAALNEGPTHQANLSLDPKKAKQIQKLHNTIEEFEEELEKASRSDMIIDRLVHGLSRDSLFEDVDEPEGSPGLKLGKHDRKAVHARALHRAGLWVSPKKEDTVDDLLHSHLMPKQDVKRTFNTWLQTQRKRQKGLWVE